MKASNLPLSWQIVPAEDPLMRKRRRQDVLWQQGDAIKILQDANGGYFTSSQIQQYNGPLVLSAYGIPEGARLLVELLAISPTTTFFDPCGTFAYDIQEGEVISEGFLQAPGSRVNEYGDLVTNIWNISSENPVAILSGMLEGQFYQLVLDFGTSTVPADSKMAFTVQFAGPLGIDFSTLNDGLQNVSFDDRPDLWIPTGITRCLLPDDPQTVIDTGNGINPREERLLVGPNGQTHWLIIRPLTWTDTGQIRDPGTDSYVEKEQTTYCGHTKWVQGLPMKWTDTGRTRLATNANIIEKQQVNEFGRFRWQGFYAQVARIPLTPIQWGVGEHGSSSSHTYTILPLENRPWTVDILGYAFDSGSKPTDATVAISMPHGSGSCYIYPTNTTNLNATVPVWTRSGTSTSPTYTLVGYAFPDPYGMRLSEASGTPGATR